MKPERYNPEEEQKKAIESFEEQAKAELEKMSPEKREKFFKGRKEIKRKNP